MPYMYRPQRLTDEEGKDIGFEIDTKGQVYDKPEKGGTCRTVGVVTRDGKLHFRDKYVKKFPDRAELLVKHLAPVEE